MKRFGLVAAAVAVLGGCGGGGDDSSCGSGERCGAGYYCARTPDGNVCWPDKAKPVISAAAASCPTDPCRRDSVLHVTATVSDESAMGTVLAVLDVDPDHPRALALGTGGDYSADIPLAEVPFPYFEHVVGVTVTAKDEAENAADDVSAGAKAVTRARWTAPLKGTLQDLLKTLPPKPGPDPQHVAAWSVVGAGATVVVVGAVLASQARSAQSKANGATDPATYTRERKRARDRRSMSNLALGVGGAAVAAGLTWRFVF